jgi:hypothetical protein
MRIVVSLLTAALFVAAAQATPAPNPSTIDIIRQPSLLRQKLAGNNCQTTCSGSAAGSSATLIASNVIVLSADPFGSQSPPLGNLGRAFVFVYGSGPVGVAIWSLRLPRSSPGGGRRSA